MNSLTIAISGANGYIGRNLLAALQDDYRVIALQRGETPRKVDASNTIWRQVDFFSLSSSENALEGVDIAFYFIHSMLPQTRLFQGNFADTDLLLADNFARACKRQGVKQIIFLGGPAPSGIKLSHHLESRHQVEEILKSSGIPVTVLRASMVVGHGGSSFEILRNLTKNLPIMLLPKWTQNETHVIYVEDVMRVMKNCINNEICFNQTFNLVNGEKLCYEDLLRKTAEGMKLKRLFIRVPFNLLQLSKRWVSYFGNADINLVSPLVDSLNINLSQPPCSSFLSPMIQERNYEQMVRKVCVKDCLKKQTHHFHRPRGIENTVRSIQHLPQCSDLNCQDISRLYFYFLPELFHSLIRVKVKEHQLACFYIWPIQLKLLELKHIAERSDESRHLFYIIGGLLVKRRDYGWLEFRQIANKKYTLAVIHEYIPSLPWYLYRITQAPIHSFVMKRFGRFLKHHCQRS